MADIEQRGIKRKILDEVDTNTTSCDVSFLSFSQDAKKRRLDADKKLVVAPTKPVTTTSTMTTTRANNNTSRVTGTRTNNNNNSSRANLNRSNLNTSTVNRAGNTSRMNSSMNTSSMGRTTTTRRPPATTSGRSNLNSSRLNTSTTRVNTTRGTSTISQQRKFTQQQQSELEMLLAQQAQEKDLLLQQTQVNYEDSQRQLEETKSTLRAIHMEKGELSQHLSSLKQQYDHAERELKMRSEDLVHTNNRLSNALEDSERELKLLKERYINLEDKFSRLQREKDEEESRYRREKLDLESKADSQRRELMQEMDRLREDQDRFVRQLKEDYEKAARNSKLEFDRVMTSLQNENRTLKIDLDFSEGTCKTQKEKIEELETTLQQKLAELQSLEQKLVLGEDERRKLHNTIMELKGNIRVFCRVRPTRTTSAVNVLETDSLITVAHKDKKSNYNYDKVFGPESGQQVIFDEISQLVQSSLDGYKVSIFAYGQTGSGKTHTMEGSQSDPGVIPRSVQKIFHTIQVKSTMNEYKHWSYNVSVTYLEIYNETIRDLLSNSKTSDQKFDIKHENGVAYVPGLTTENVASSDQILHLLKRATKNRSVASTNVNERSSRSHSVFTLSIIGTNRETGQKSHGVLNLIDLAGSERIANSGATGDRLKETVAINSSLTSLGDVILALVSKQKHIPYRNSKLTYLLQPYLDGEGKCLMFVNIGPEVECTGETICSLRFASKVNGCDLGVAQRRIK